MSNNFNDYFYLQCLTSKNEDIIGQLYCLPHSDQMPHSHIYGKNISFDDYEYNINPYKMNEEYEKVYTELAYMQIYAIATIGILSLLPTSFTNWEESDDQKDFLKKHSDNIDKGPVIDNDDWAVNYIGHTVAGSYYYIWGRQAGLSWQESFILTTIMSTMYWEYGWEAFAETPSTQDLIITPILGSLLGEVTNHLYSQIRYNNNEVYGSKTLGSISRVLLNPIGEVNQYFNNYLNDKNIKLSVDYSFNQNRNNYSPSSLIENNYYLNNASFSIKFNLNY